MSSSNRTDIIKYFLKQQFKPTDETPQNNNVVDKPIETPKKLSKSKKYKWTSLIHNGMKFPEEYTQKNIPLI